MDIGPTLINPSIHAEIIGSLTQKLRALYVFPEIATHLCENLQNHLDNGDYTDLKEGELLALALTIHLQEIAHDEHLWVRWHPEPPSEDEQALPKSKAWQAERRLEAQLDNDGLHRVERLPGNVGYLDIRYFHRPAWAGIEAAYRLALDTVLVTLGETPAGPYERLSQEIRNVLDPKSRSEK